MKKAAHILRMVAMLGVLALSLVSCGNFLTVQPQGYVIPKTDEEFASILHNILKDVEGGGDEQILGNMDVIARREGCADDLDANIKVGSLTSYAGEVINARMTDYRETYNIIKDCNILIDNLEFRQSDEARNIVAAACAIKGICFYNLMRDYCEAWDAESCSTQLGLVLVDRFSISERSARASLKETAAYAEGLLRRSLSIGLNDKKYFFTPLMVKAYLARLLFWCEDWTEAAKVCEDIMDNSGLEITGRDAYSDMIMAANDAKGEVICRSHINNSSELDWYFSYVKGYIKSRPASLSLISLFGDKPQDDIRYAIGFDSRRYCLKTPECRVRLSEILLMLAECRVHQGGREQEALDLLNHLRERRILDAEPLTLATLPAVRKDSRISVDATGKTLTPLMQAVFDERRRELFLEGDRWFELKRNGSPEWWIINNGLKYTTKKYLYTAPLYKADVDVYKEVKQNEGYN